MVRLLITAFYLLLIVSCSIEKSNEEKHNPISLDDSLVSINTRGIKHTFSYANHHKITLREYQIVEKLLSIEGMRLRVYSEDNSHHITNISIGNVPYNSFETQLNALKYLSTISLDHTGLKNLTVLERFKRIEHLNILDTSLQDTLKIPSRWENLETLSIRDSSVHVVLFPKENKLKSLFLMCDLKYIDSSFFYLRDLEYLETYSPLLDKIDKSSFKKLKTYYYREH
jgi:hypothetical protein